ncbi:hypothetical protein BC834DRAFT_846883 [Gloeopeniophorella convolvens]|nr:hypothetical protein BC834DRAFT_846883 [Gloeopeniophorella convolvens]
MPPRRSSQSSKKATARSSSTTVERSSTTRKHKTAQNLVDSLPPEVLRRILLFESEIDPPGNYGWGNSKSKGYRLGWIRFSHVCRKWRQAALDYPTIWADIHFSIGAHWVEEMLSRSNPSALRLDMGLARGTGLARGMLPVDKFLAKHLPRTEFLRTAPTMSKDGGGYSKWLSTPAPCLKELTFVSFLYGSPKVRVSNRLPDHPFGDQAPNLRSITIIDCKNFFWGSSLLQNLSTLILGEFDPPYIASDEEYEEYEDEDEDKDKDKDEHSMRPSYDQLLSVLESMAHLETLHLNFCLPRKLPREAARTIKIPTLKTLVLQDAATECLDVFGSLRVPNARLTILLSDSWGGPSMESRIVSQLEKHFAKAHTPVWKIDTLEVVLDTVRYRFPSTLLLAGARDLGPNPDYPTPLSYHRDSLTLPLYLSVPNFAGNAFTAFTLLTAGLWPASSRRAMRVLSIDLPNIEWDISIWREVAFSLPDVRELYLSEDLAVSFLEECTPHALRSWHKLESVRLSPMHYYSQRPGSERHFKNVLLDWLKSYRDVSLQPPAVFISEIGNFDFGSDSDDYIGSDSVGEHNSDDSGPKARSWIDEVAKYGDVDIRW